MKALALLALLLLGCPGTPASEPSHPSRPGGYGAQATMDLRQFADLECACADRHDEECSRKVSAERDDYYQKIDRTQPMSDADKAAIDIEEKRFHDCLLRVRGTGL